MLCIRGMEGLGDSFHHRAIIRQLLARGESILLETSWPSVFHDLVGAQLQLVFPGLRHRTQIKNALRERHLYSGAAFPQSAKVYTMHFRPRQGWRFRSVLGEMWRSFDGFGLDLDAADFRLSVPKDWAPELRARLAEAEKPLLFYRPLVDRSNWRVSRARNPDGNAYAALYQEIRDGFCVVSVADLKRGEEWIVGTKADADIEFHAGELGVRELCVLASMSAFVFASPGFAVPLAQAIGTPTIAVFGNFENSRSFCEGAKFTPYCAIDTVSKCQHFQPYCNCSKRIDLPAGIAKLRHFVEQHSRQAQAA